MSSTPIFRRTPSSLSRSARRAGSNTFSPSFSDFDPAAASLATIPNLHTDDDDEDTSKQQSFAWKCLFSRVPFLQKLQAVFYRVPRRVRLCLFCVWILWKIVLLLVFLIIFMTREDGQVEGSNRMDVMYPTNSTRTGNNHPTRLLYVMTTLTEYNTGARQTQKDQDRLAEVMLPVLVDGIRSMIDGPYHYQVDVYLICGYELRPEREQFLRDSLPPGVGLEIWDSAPPLGYDNRFSKDKLIPNTRALARQHRYVIRDKFHYYDAFVAFEDDMRITGHHVHHFLELSDEIDKLRLSAPENSNGGIDHVDDVQKTKFHGDMSKSQMARLIPGFVRVEVLSNGTESGAQNQVLPIPQDFEIDGLGVRHVDPSICCSRSSSQNTSRVSEIVSPSDLIIWEANIKAFSMRQMPTGSSILDWVVLMMGPGKRMKNQEKLGGYWSGREGAFGDETKPSGGDPKLVAQQGGWMMTKEQIARLESGLCMSNFLPPFNEPSFKDDGQQSMNVEFWSGSYQLFTGVVGGCNMQRVISVHPDHFSKHLIYHTANNKQLQLGSRRMVQADNLYGQLNTVKKMAEKAKRLSTDQP